MELLQLNKFANLHNGKTIFFFKTQHYETEFKKIRRIKNEVILISGNSDDPVNEIMVSKMPGNVLRWYCQNNQVYHSKLITIPIGLENSIEPKIRRMGVSWPHAIQKHKFINKHIVNTHKSLPSRFIYANFNVDTNLAHRQPIRNICKQSTFITWNEPLLDYDVFVAEVLDHEAVICPAGNGIDTHRLYEILYSGRIPITIKTGNYPLYSDLYEQLPIVILDTIDELQDFQKLKALIISTIQKHKHIELLDFNYWQQEIKNLAVCIMENRPNFLKQLITKFS
jgi:hypothetical protein